MTRQLLDDKEFESILSYMNGMTWFRVHWPGKAVGDVMSNESTGMLFERHGIEVTTNLDEAEGIVFDGGGNIGPPWSQERVRKPYVEMASQRGLKVVMLPQSANLPVAEPFPSFVKAFAREATTAAMMGWEMAPDMAMCYQVDDDVPLGGNGRAIVRRSDVEKMTPLGLNDIWFKSVIEMLEFCCQYEEIETDRLHLAIAGLLLGKDVFLWNTTYHKNLSMYETWLRELGCKWMTR